MPAPVPEPPSQLTGVRSILGAADQDRLDMAAIDRLLPAHLSLLEHAHGFAKAHILSAMVELGVPEALRTGPLSADELAVLVGGVVANGAARRPRHHGQDHRNEAPAADVPGDQRARGETKIRG